MTFQKTRDALTLIDKKGQLSVEDILMLASKDLYEDVKNDCGLPTGYVELPVSDEIQFVNYMCRSYMLMSKIYEKYGNLISYSKSAARWEKLDKTFGDLSGRLESIEEDVTKIQARQKEADALETECNKKLQELGSLEKRLEEKNRQNAILQGRVARLEQTAEEIRNIRENLIPQAEQSCRNMLKKKQAAEEEFEGVKVRLQTAQEDYDAADEQCRKAVAALSKKLEEKQAMQQKASGIRKQAADAEEAAKKMKTEMDADLTSIRSAEQWVKDFTPEYEARKAKREDLEKQESNLRQSLEAEKKLNASLEEETENLKKLLLEEQDRSRARENCRSLTGKTEENIKTINMELAEMALKVKLLTEHYADLQVQMKDKEQEKADKEDEKKKLEQTNKDLDAQVAAAEKINQGIRDSNGKLEDRLKAVNEELKSLQSQDQETQNQIDEYTKKQREIQKKRSDNQRRIDAIVQSTQDQEEAYASEMETIAGLRNTYVMRKQDADSAIRNHKEQAAAYHKEQQWLSERITELLGSRIIADAYDLEKDEDLQRLKTGLDSRKEELNRQLDQEMEQLEEILTRLE